MPERRFKKGDKVLAKWPKSILYFEGEVLDFNDIEYLIKFEDEDQSQMAIKYRDVMPTGVRKRSTSRSPARSSRKSPSRKSPSRKSPSRRSPSRRSPARTSSTRSQTTSKSPSRKLALETSNSIKSISKSITPKKASVNNNSKVMSSFTSSLLNSNNSTKEVITSIRQSARIASIAKANEVETTISKISTSTKSSSSTTGCGAMSTFVSKVACGLKCFWGITWPALKSLPLIAALLTLPYAYTAYCKKLSCSLQTLPTVSTSLKDYYDQTAVLSVLGFFALQFVLSFLPIKTRVLPNGAKARGNAIVSLLLTLLALCGAHYYQIPITKICQLSKQLVVTMLVLAVIFSLLLYVKSFYSNRSQLNPHLSGHFLPDLLAGRELSPRIGSFDVKTYLFQCVMISSVVFNVLLMLRDYQSIKLPLNQVLMVVCGLQILYSLDWMMFQDSYYSSFEYKSYGCGLMFCSLYMSFPAFFAFFAKFVFTFRPVMPSYCLVFIALLYLIANLVERAANNQKHAFRKNPSDPKVAHLESIPSPAGRIIVSGWWGLVRHPNYFAEIFKMLSITLCCGFSHGMPWVMFSMSLLAGILVRVFEVEAAMADKYGRAWDTYTSIVKARVLPKIF